MVSRNLSDKTIMIVDDEPVVLKTLANIVRHFNFNVVTENDGLRSIMLYREYKPDVVLLDVRMTGVNGMETYDAIKKANPDAIVIFITAYPRDPKFIEFLSKTNAIYLPKPFSLAKLKETLESVLQKRMS
jgi:CheY-like chemotaxis protein